MSVTTLPARTSRAPAARLAGAAVRLQAVPDRRVCLTPAIGLLLVFLTYPLGLGIWLAFTDTTIGRRGVVRRLREFPVSADRSAVVERGVLQRVLHGDRDVRKIRARLLAGAAAQQPSSVQEHPARHHPAALDRADGAVGAWRSGGSTIRSSRSSPMSWSTCCTSAPPISTSSGRRLAGALLADRRQHLARHSVRRDLAAGRPADHLALALRGGDARRRHAPGSASASSPSR